MGKVKIRTIGDESLENEQKQKAKQKSTEKKYVKGIKGGERVISVGPSEEEVAKISLLKEEKEVKKEPKKAKKEIKEAKKEPRSKSYQKVAATLDKNKKHNIADGLSVLEKLVRSKFDETVELHINTTSTGAFGNITLPHGTGKQIRIAIASDDLLATVSQGKINFDVLLATPDMMPKLARVAKILGPKGLMPNPKNATLVKDPSKAAEEFKKGQITLKTEGKAPIMHLIVGKMSFGPKKLSENITVLIEAIGKDKIHNVTLKSTMSPAVRLEI